MVNYVLKLDFRKTALKGEDRFDAVCAMVGDLIQMHDSEDVSVIYWKTLDGPVLEEEEALERDMVFMEVECL
jgi:hypothetical protein